MRNQMLMKINLCESNIFEMQQINREKQTKTDENRVQNAIVTHCYGSIEENFYKTK